MKLPNRTLLALALALAAAPAARAQRAAPGPLTITATNVTAAAQAAGGQRRASEAVQRGDVVRYHLAFTNPGAGSVRRVVLADPIPAGLRLVEGSTRASRSDARVEFSADGGKSFSPQPMETVTVNGQPVRRPVPAARYTHVRWTVDGAVAPHATVTAEFDARLEAAAQSAPAPSQS
jgi:uncharacterized repeat protein (TIGR01451 family)